jgi:choline dehydrogenase
VFYDERFNWKYTTGAEPHLNGQPMYWPRGKVLGGSSSINAMVYVRGHARDFDEWGDVAPGWGWTDVEPVFRRMEDWQGAPDPARGTGGLLSVSDMSDAMHPLTHAYVKGAGEAGVPYNPDYNAGEMCGASFYQITTRDGFRASTARAYLKTAPSALKIETGALATRLMFDGSRAIGVRYKRSGQDNIAKARAEVILCSGAINTPQLLQLSGIGPADHLQSLGIDVVQNAPQVGQNLMDHLGFDFLFEATQPSLNQVLRPWWGKARVGLQYLLTRKGPLAMSLNQGGGFVRVSDHDGPPDLQLYFSPLSYSRAPAGTRPLMSPDPFPAYRLGFNPCKPTSTGYVRIASPDPAVAPEMQANYLATEEDRQMMINGFRLIRRMADSPALTATAKAEVSPGAQIESDAQILEFIRGDSWTVFHQCGTARMGNDPAQSVVDARLRVHGIHGLRVADASVFPTIPSGNTNAPAIMVGEKASDIIKEDAR